MSSIFFQKELEQIKKKKQTPKEIIEGAKQMRAENKLFISILVAAICGIVWIFGFVNNFYFL